jgi:hypothetical protein
MVGDQREIQLGGAPAVDAPGNRAGIGDDPRNLLRPQPRARERGPRGRLLVVLERDHVEQLQNAVQRRQGAGQILDEQQLEQPLADLGAERLRVDACGRIVERPDGHVKRAALGQQRGDLVGLRAVAERAGGVERVGHERRQLDVGFRQRLRLPAELQKQRLEGLRSSRRRPPRRAARAT